MKKILLMLTLSMVLVLSLAACGGSSESTSSGAGDESAKEDKGEVVLVDSGYTIKSVDSDVYAYWGAVIKNENKTKANELPKIVITAYDDKDEVVATEDQMLGHILPGEEQAYGSLLDCNGEKPKRVEISVENGEEINVPEDAVDSSNFEITGDNEKEDEEIGDIAWTGKVKNNSKKDVDNVSIVVLLKKDGKIVYGTTSYVDNLKAGADKPFEVSEFDVPEHDEYVIKAIQWI